MNVHTENLRAPVSRHIPSTHATLKNHIAICEIAGVTLIFAYLPPSSDKSLLTQLMVLAAEYVTTPESMVVVAGDLNARSALLTGDKTTSDRGRELEAAVDASPFLVQQPVSGKWTTHTFGGEGIPDVVLSNFAIRDLKVLENEDGIGSDHRPLVFSLPELKPRAKVQRKWNVRGLAQPRKATRFGKILAEDGELGVLEKEAWNAVAELRAETLEGEELQARLDGLCDGLVSRLSLAAEKALGKRVYDTRIPRDFWTQELDEEREAARAALIEAMAAKRDPTVPDARVRELWNSSRARTEKLGENLRKRATHKFQKAVDEASNPALMKMVKCSQSRNSGGGCALDPEKIDDFAGHFDGTFGGASTGEVPDLAEPGKVPERAELAVEEVVNFGSVRKTVKELPRGKAWGVDEVPAEFLVFGGEALVPVLVALLSLTFLSERIPSSWKIALVVPIWKKKGSSADIANYRPISLTSVLRRLYERLLLADVNRFTDQLADAQGGFRPKRGTSHQALLLHEALVANSKFARVALLDLRAAYDLAARERLWHKLRTDYGFPPHSVARIAVLFDENVSRLVVGGKQSRDIRNLRGLLQGSSMSPALFNFLINELAREWLKLQERGVGLNVHGEIINSALFADDAAALGKDDRELGEMLEVGEAWSRRAGMEFSPSKCVVFGVPPAQRSYPQRIYGVDLANVERAHYLGFPFTRLGIDFAELCRERCAKARAVIQALRAVGMNVTGWAPAASAQVYITFVRAILEYGLDIAPYSKALAELYQKVQNLALRILFSAPANTAVGAMHRVLGLQMFADRWCEIGFLGASRFMGTNNESIVGVRVWRNASSEVRYPLGVPTGVKAKRFAFGRKGRLLEKGSVPRAVLEGNPLCVEFRAELDTYAAAPLTRGTPTILPPPMPKAERKRRRVVALKELGDPLGIPGAIQVREDGKPHELLGARTAVTRADRVSITRWQLGMVAGHQDCRKCSRLLGEEVVLTRAHAVVCAGVDDILMWDEAWGGEPVLWDGHSTGIDSVCNAGKEEMTRERAGMLVEAITRIEVLCRGRERTEMGFYRAPDVRGGVG